MNFPRALRWRLVALAATTCCLVALGCGSSTTRVVHVFDKQRATKPTTVAPTLADAVAKAKSGVIRVETDSCQGTAIGTGFLLGPTLVATVEHVVDGATHVRLIRDGKLIATASIVGADPARDVALLRASQPISGHVFSLDRRTPRLGEDVAAIGFPLGLPLSVTRGSVSGLDRTVPILGYDRHRLIQTDAAVNPGNSGGPLLAITTGDVLGLVDLKDTQASGLGFAVSADVAGRLLDRWTQAPQPVSSVSCAQTPAAASGPAAGSSSPGPTYPPSSVQPAPAYTTPDSGNPCDPNSSAYDQATCNGTSSNPAPPPTDSGDPCDPTSTAYDQATCDANSGNPPPADTTSTPSTPSTPSDPCDPNNPNYDPSQC